MLTDDSSDKRASILRATLQLLSVYGFHGFSMKQLASEANVAAGTLYLYFLDRQDLIRQLHLEIIQTFAFHALNDHDPQAPLREQYRRVCLNIWHFCRDNPAILLSKGQFDHLPPDMLRDHHEDAWQALGPLRVMFDRCRQQNLVKMLPNEILAAVGIDALIGLARKCHLGMAAVDETLLNEVLDAAWDAIAKHPGNRF